MPSVSQSQEQKLLQKQVPAQQMIRLMQLVEIPNMSLEQEIRKEADANPALEIYDDSRDDEPSDARETAAPDEYDDNGDPLELTAGRLPDDEIFREDYYRDDGLDEYPTEAQIERAVDRLNAPDGTGREHVQVYHSSLHEDWQRQLDEMDMTGQQAQIARYIVGYLDSSGYLTAHVQAIAAEMLYMENVYTDAGEVEAVLTEYVQELDPPGTGARDLRECLLLQLKRMTPSEAVSDAARILDAHFDDFVKRRRQRLLSALQIDERRLDAAAAVIRKLDPRPADEETPMEKTAGQITPDFIIDNVDGKLQLSLNSQYVPKVRINKEFSNEYRFLGREAGKKRREEAEKFMKEYVDRGNAFIHSLSLREMILYNTMYAIMKRQEEYFLTGDETALKPMILKNVADEVKLDVSTVSRVSNSKYVQTDFGIVALKKLFSEAVNSGDVSSREIKRVLSDIIAGEDKGRPFSDDALCGLLAGKGYRIARRTVAKYREQLGLPSARMRQR